MVWLEKTDLGGYEEGGEISYANSLQFSRSIGEPLPRYMKLGTILAILVFLLVAVVHILRLVGDWDVVINGVVIPKWTSILGVLITGGLAFLLWRET